MIGKTISYFVILEKLGEGGPRNCQCRVRTLSQYNIWRNADDGFPERGRANEIGEGTFSCSVTHAAILIRHPRKNVIPAAPLS
jgi:hypothetical protein